MYFIRIVYNESYCINIYVIFIKKIQKILNRRWSQQAKPFLLQVKKIKKKQQPQLLDINSDTRLFKNCLQI